jgi:hypothetical protein
MTLCGQPNQLSQMDDILSFSASTVSSHTATARNARFLALGQLTHRARRRARYQITGSCEPAPESPPCEPRLSRPPELATRMRTRCSRAHYESTAHAGRWYLWRALSDGAAADPPPPLITQRAFRPAPGPVADTTAVRHSGDHERAGATG